MDTRYFEKQLVTGQARGQVLRKGNYFRCKDAPPEAIYCMDFDEVQITKFYKNGRVLMHRNILHPVAITSPRDDAKDGKRKSVVGFSSGASNIIPLSTYVKQYFKSSVDVEKLKGVLKDASAGIDFAHLHGFALGSVSMETIYMCTIGDMEIAKLLVSEELKYGATKMDMKKDLKDFGALIEEIITGKCRSDLLFDYVKRLKHKDSPLCILTDHVFYWLEVTISTFIHKIEDVNDGPTKKRLENLKWPSNISESVFTDDKHGKRRYDKNNFLTFPTYLRDKCYHREFDRNIVKKKVSEVLPKTLLIQMLQAFSPSTYMDISGS